MSKQMADQETQSDCLPLANALGPHFGDLLAELPEALRERVERELPVPWDKLDADLRRVLASEVDALSVYPQDMQRREDFLAQKREVESEIARWETIATPAARDVLIQEQRLIRLRQQLASLDNQLARGDYLEERKHESRERSREHLNHDPVLQARANQIAKTKKAESGRWPTKGQVANILAKDGSLDASTIERRIRSEWKNPGYLTT